MRLTVIDWLILGLYICFVLGTGAALRRRTRTSTDFFLAGRSLPAWICGLAFISANLGAQEVIGMAASGAKYGIATSHFYWLGAIPAMVFVGICMMPFYYGSRARSVPEYLRIFDAAFNRLGIEASWIFHLSIVLSALIVLGYIFLGGLTSAIYNEVLQ